MPGIFDHKIFNGEVFKGFVDRIPNPNRNELIKSRAIRPRPDLAAAMADQAGGNYMTSTLTGVLDSTEAQNYDGNNDMAAKESYNFAHSRVVVGRMNAWVERDFSYDLTGNHDHLEDVAEQVGEYWYGVDQNTLVHILNGVFRMVDDEGVKFTAAHTYDVTAKTNSDGVLGCMDGTTLNTAMQRACGDNKGKFSLAIMHSAVATNLENLKLLTYLKYTDKDGIARDLTIGTLNGRTVLIDDGMPVTETITTQAVKGVHTITVGTAGVTGDTLTVDGIAYTFGTATSTTKKTLAVGSSAADQASALKTVLAAQYDGIFTVTVSGAVVTLTQIIGGNGDLPVVAVTGTVKATAATTTTGVAGVKTEVYTTYVLGDGAIEYTDCGARVPYEVDRDPARHGGEDTLYSRQRKSFAPYGISFTKAVMAKLSPTDEELENGANWELVSTLEASDKRYIAHKSIPIARIKSRG